MRKADQREWTTIILAFIVLALLAVPVLAQPPQGYWGEGHATYHHLFKDMRNSRGLHCCNSTKSDGGDCSLTQARWNVEADTWEMRVNGQWTLMDDPTDRVLDDMGIIEPFVCFGKHTQAVYCYSPGGGI